MGACECLAASGLELLSAGLARLFFFFGGGGASILEPGSSCEEWSPIVGLRNVELQKHRGLMMKPCVCARVLKFLVDACRGLV